MGHAPSFEGDLKEKGLKHRCGAHRRVLSGGFEGDLKEKGLKRPRGRDRGRSGGVLKET